MLWNGEAEVVLSQWRRLHQETEIPSDEALPKNDPRYSIQRGVAYLTNNLRRVDYPRYRKLGLPIISALMEFTMRVKGTERYWTTRKAPK
jgi:hypothetical protein